MTKAELLKLSRGEKEALLVIYYSQEIPGSVISLCELAARYLDDIERYKRATEAMDMTGATESLRDTYLRHLRIVEMLENGLFRKLQGGR